MPQPIPVPVREAIVERHRDRKESLASIAWLCPKTGYARFGVNTKTKEMSVSAIAAVVNENTNSHCWLIAAR